jgi:hypothetical protein
MKHIRKLALLLTISSLSAAEVTPEDIEALRDWVNTKRMVTVKELGGQLSISGEIRATMKKIADVRSGKNDRSKLHLASNPYNIRTDLLFDYRTTNTWASARLRFDNNAGITSAGIGSGETTKLKVDRAYYGYRVIDFDRHTADVELGRRLILNVFESKMQFGSNFDGFNFKDQYAVEDVGDLYYTVGAFLINDHHNQAGYAGELGIMNMLNTGFYTKYSLIDWNTKSSLEDPQRFQFIVSQLLLGYRYIPVKFDKIINFYLAGLWNHRARARSISANKRSNYGGYLGFNVGQLKKEGDWSIDANYQLLAAQCVPDYDVQGLGLGGARNSNFYTGSSLDHSAGEGKGNYRGFEITVQYLITNNLNVFQQYRQAVTLDSDIGPFRRFKQYEVDFIYLF